MISTVVFDLDGLLADTETLHCRAYQDVLRAHGVGVSDAAYADHWIRSGKGIVEFVQEHNLAIDIPAVRRAKSGRYAELVASFVTPMPGALELLRRLHGRKRMALASSSYRESIGTVLRALDIESFFEVIVSKESVERAKPFPDIFLLAAECLRTPPASCVVLEDAEKGVVAARAAGMKCIAVPNEHTAANDFSAATLVVSTLHDVTLELLDSGLAG